MSAALKGVILKNPRKLRSAPRQRPPVLRIEGGGVQDREWELMDGVGARVHPFIEGHDSVLPWNREKKVPCRGSFQIEC